MNLRVGDPFSGHEAVSVTSLITPVLLCGGGGTRLWPLSHSSQPKQFQPLLTKSSPFQSTLQRLSQSGYRNAVVVTAKNYQTLVNKQLREQGYHAATMVIEPSPKNSGAAVLAAALTISKSDPDAILFVTPSDHQIEDQAVLDQAVALGLPSARDGKIVTFGIKPDRAASEYGWINPSDHTRIISSVQRFIEKPDQYRAAQLLAAKTWLWNSGIFLMSARTILAEAALHCPDLLRAVRHSVEAGLQSNERMLVDEAAWEGVESEPIDKAIMEKSQNLRVIKVSAGWSDLGDWNAIWRESQKDPNGVVATGKATAIDCQDSLLRSSDVDGPHLVGIGLNQMIAVATRDSVLVTPRNRAQDVRLGAALNVRNFDITGPLVSEMKPWGGFEILASGLGYQVKRLTVEPGAKLSLQSHRFRSEHWVVA
ncbi:MAG: mannose-1-phosphate guanylyltransferase/mannose-6-phosphate isomerase, partial [Deltaproteobacteria bacterium]